MLRGYTTEAGVTSGPTSQKLEDFWDCLYYGVTTIARQDSKRVHGHFAIAKDRKTW